NDQAAIHKAGHAEQCHSIFRFAYDTAIRSHDLVQSHQRIELARRFVPPAMIVFLQPFGLNFRRDDYAGDIHSVTAPAPQSQQEFMVFPSRKIRREEAESLEHIAAERSV